MKRLELLFTTFATVIFILSLWLVPTACIVGAILVKYIWVKILAGIFAGIWLYCTRPWNIFKNGNFSKFLNDLSKAIYIIWGV